VWARLQEEFKKHTFICLVIALSLERKTNSVEASQSTDRLMG
jgi:hypothetical protein